MQACICSAYVDSTNATVIQKENKVNVLVTEYIQASVTILADFCPEFNPPFRWRSKHQTKNHCAYH